MKGDRRDQLDLGVLGVPIPAVVVGFLCALEALFLYLLPNFGISGPGASPFAFEELWFQGHGALSLQETFLGGNVLLAIVLWGCYRVDRSRYPSGPGWRWVSYVGAGFLLGAVQWGCRALSMAAPKIVITRIYP